jgi:hypothetical protein
MKLKQIKVGQWYETRVGIGECKRVGGTFPPSLQVRIVAPLPRGVVNVIPRDVVRALSDAEVAPFKGEAWEHR